MHTKQNFEIVFKQENKKTEQLDSLTFCLPRSISRSFSFLFHFFALVAGLSLDFIYQVKVSRKRLFFKHFTRWLVSFLNVAHASFFFKKKKMFQTL